ncbi:parB-like partition protein [Eggerthella sp. CAG:368]|nr:parB-like partition protein [Eggerthella sp. CAG:368]
MVKQKSGLGRGLNALFDEVDTNPAIKKTSSITKEENKTTQPQSTVSVQETNKTTSTYTGGVIGSVVNHQQPKKEEKKETKASSSIYFSEDALENAKVVEREARKTPTFRTTPEQKRKTAEIQAEQKKSTASSVLSGNSVSIQETPKPEKVEKKDEKGTVGEVELSKVQPNPDQPRTHFKPEEIEELANSIKKEGLLQPILVNKVGDHYQIIAGERRWQACKSLDMKTIPVRFWTADNDKALELALIENIQRSDLNPIEEAYGYKRLMERKGMTQSEVAQTVSKGRSTIANALRLLDLPEEAQQLLFEEKISAGHARAILSIPTPEGRKTLTNKLVNEKLSVRETESIARLLSGRDKSKEAGTSKRLPTPASFKKAARSLSKFLSAPVRVKTVQGKNKIEIQFQDEEELERILNAIAERE